MLYAISMHFWNQKSVETDQKRMKDNDFGEKKPLILCGVYFNKTYTGYLP